MQRPTSVKNVVKPSILTAANPWDKMRLRGSSYDHQHTQIKQEKHPNVPVAQNSRIQLGRGTCEGSPGFSGLTSLGSKDPSITSHDGTSKRIFYGSVQKSLMWESASSKFQNITPSFHESSSSSIAKDSQARCTVANAVRIEPKHHNHRVTDYGELLPHSEIKPKSCEPIFSPP
ncbi:hypothetical protein H6P81_019263 [Aristolochia fimbriata]|uniref:Uncharacterized protein n=1 Tax=Aristolochia fimbriata TaxID=158543 RepID=A0AAV7DVX2_ARIFI|nr:hypothetical protein H6P81_019263 [Aristolochia fimbriata]